MRTNMRHRFRVIAVCTIAWAIPDVGHAQKTGALSTDTQEERVRVAQDADRLGLRSDLLRAQNRAVLLFDPELASATRASAHSLNVVFVDELREGRLQLNLCDVARIARIAQKIVGIGCDSTGLLLMLAGPLNDEQAVDLLDRHGLVGEARVEIAMTWKIGDTSWIRPAFRGVLARPKFSFFSTPTLAEQEKRHEEYRLEPGLSVKTPTWSLFAGYVLERDFKPQQTQNVCRPASFGPPGTIVCSDMVVGAPTKQNTQSARLEGKLVSAGLFAVGAAFEHDFVNHENSLEVPAYFLTTTATKNKPAFAGGARITFVTKKKTSFTVFIDTFKL